MEEKHKVTSAEASALLRQQLGVWPLVAQNFKALEAVHLKQFEWNGLTVKVQFNPARIVSSGAKVDAKSIKARKCFLCPNHLPEEQLRLPFGERYQVLCNPFPIFPEHFTIPSLAHTPQLIVPQLDDFLEVVRSLDRFTLFYNGPRCGASAPDHAHFQAVTFGLMPLLHHYLRNGFILKAKTKEAMRSLFLRIYALLPVPEGEAEPMMNLFGWYREEEWILALIPRKRHRPWQYEAEGADHLLSSPGAADIGGLFITPLAEDFEKINPALLQDVYEQVCWSDQEVMELFLRLSND